MISYYKKHISEQFINIEIIANKGEAKMRIEVSNNFLTVDIYKGEQLVSAIDLEGSVIELVKELTDLFAVLDIDYEVIEID